MGEGVLWGLARQWPENEPARATIIPLLSLRAQPGHAGVTGGCVESVVATEHHGSGEAKQQHNHGLTGLELIEAELGRREQALQLVLGSSHHTTYVSTYSDLAQYNISPIQNSGATNAVKGLASAGERTQPAAASGVPTKHNNETQVRTTSSTSLFFSEGLAP